MHQRELGHAPLRVGDGGAIPGLRVHGHRMVGNRFGQRGVGGEGDGHEPRQRNRKRAIDKERLAHVARIGGGAGRVEILRQAGRHPYQRGHVGKEALIRVLTGARIPRCQPQGTERGAQQHDDQQRHRGGPRRAPPGGAGGRWVMPRGGGATHLEHRYRAG